MQVGVGKRLRFVDVDAVYLNHERAYRAMSALLGDIERGGRYCLAGQGGVGSVGHALAGAGRYDTVYGAEARAAPLYFPAMCGVKPSRDGLPGMSMAVSGSETHDRLAVPSAPLAFSIRSRPA